MGQSWREEFSVGVDELDEQHQGMVARPQLLGEVDHEPPGEAAGTPIS